MTSDWKRWHNTINVNSVGAAYIYLSAYIQCLFDHNGLKKEDKVELVYFEDGDTLYFFVVDAKDKSAIINIPLLKAEATEENKKSEVLARFARCLGAEGGEKWN